MIIASVKFHYIWTGPCDSSTLFANASLRAGSRTCAKSAGKIYFKNFQELFTKMFTINRLYQITFKYIFSFQKNEIACLVG